MIEDQLASMPSGKGRSETAQQRQHDPIGQDGLRPIQPQPGIGADNGQHHHGGNRVVPAGHAHADARNRQQFSRTYDRRQHTEHESGSGRPCADFEPERIAGEPVGNVAAQRRNHKGDGEMHQHGMDRMTSHRNGGADILLGDVPNIGVGMIGTRFLPFLKGNFRFLVLPRFAHIFAPRLKFVALCATPVLLAGCSGDLSTLDPAGPRAANLATLWWIMFWGATALFLLVMALLALAYLRSDLVTRITPAQWIIGGGLVLPVPILVLLTGSALVLGEQLLPKGGEPLRIGVEAHRWEWQFSYPNGVTLEDQTLHIPAGEPVDIEVTASDVIHAFWVPRLGGKIDAIPGHVNVIRLEADRPGIYWGQCAEYCGEGHDIMQFRVQAHEPAVYAELMAGGG